jgi:hypothetical protein
MAAHRDKKDIIKQEGILAAPVTKELVEYLEALVPERCPTLNESERDIFFYAGQRYLVSCLKTAYEIQRNNSIGSSKADKLARL